LRRNAVNDRMEGETLNKFNRVRRPFVGNAAMTLAAA
jgi:hypothetical protein